MSVSQSVSHIVTWISPRHDGVTWQDYAHRLSHGLSEASKYTTRNARILSGVDNHFLLKYFSFKFQAILLRNHTFWSANFSKSPVVNLAERHETLLVNKWVAICKQSIVTDNSEGCAHSFVNYSLFYFITKFTKYKWLYYFITQVIFRHFFNVGFGNELLRVCYNLLKVMTVL